MMEEIDAIGEEKEESKEGGDRKAGVGGEKGGGRSRRKGEGNGGRRKGWKE
jgi:hypothetical protein